MSCSCCAYCRKAALEEEQGKRRKGLELELKRLRMEVADLVKTFDDRVQELASLRLQVQSLAWHSDQALMATDVMSCAITQCRIYQHL